MESLLQDIRLALRGIVKRPGFSAVVVLSLGLAIGANTAIFSFVNATLLRPPPVREPERLVRIYTSLAGGLRWASVSYPNFRDLRDQNQVFSGITSEKPTPLILGDSGSERVLGSLVSANYFSLLGVQPALGRAFLPEEDRTANGNPVAVLSHELWQSRFAGDRSVLGKSVRLNGHAFSIIGVAPAGFAGMNVGFVPEVWIPVTMQPVAMPGPGFLENRGVAWLWVTARLKTGVSLEQARTSMDNLALRLREQYPEENEGTGLTLLPETQASIYPPVRQAFVGLAALLQVVVALVLLVACSNVAGLFLARATARRKEMALRLALGAGRRRLILQLLTESMVLAMLAGTLGLLLSLWLTRLIGSFRPPAQLPLSFSLGLDARVLIFTLLATVLTGLFFGLAPALQASRQELVPALKDSPAQGYRRSRLRSALLVAQVAVSFILLIGAGLFFRSLLNTQTVDPGFKAGNLLVASLNLGFNGYSEEQGQRFYQRIEERLAVLPEVRAVSLAAALPFDIISSTIDAVRPGFELSKGEGRPQVDFNVISPGYFATMGTPLLEGRDFTRQDTENAPRVAIVNQALARRYWPNGSALGQGLWIGGSQPHTIVAIAKDGKYTSLGEEARPYLYLPLLQRYQPAVTIHLRTGGDPAGIVPALRAEVQALDQDIVLFDVKPMSSQMDVALLPARLAGTLLAGMGLLALCLAMVGLYASTAYALTRRTREIGIRIAIGAQLGQVLRLVVREGMILAIAGVIIGLLLAATLTRFASGLLYDVSPFDPVTFAAASLLLLGVALAANWIPARRAAHIDPNRAMRLE